MDPGAAALRPEGSLFILLKFMIQCQPHVYVLQQAMPTLPMPKAGPDIEKHGVDCKIWSHLQYI